MQNYFITLEEAKKNISHLINPLTEIETKTIHHALNRVLAEDLIASFATPPYDNSAMDGYAFHSDSYQNNENPVLQLIGTAAAGHPYPGEVAIGQAVRIMTGAKIPPGCNMVVMQEKTGKLSGDSVKILQQAKAGENIRYTGEDLKPGEILLKAGKKITAVDIAFIASQGIAQINVYQKPKVAIFSTGDELREAGATLEEGQIYDTNRYALSALLKQMDIDCIDFGIIEDKPEAIEETLNQAAEKTDVIITSGGVSVGDADYVKQILEQKGNIDFWKIAMKPGKPLAFGKIHNKLFFGLPGNPVAVIVTFKQLVKPALLKLEGCCDSDLLEFTAITTEKLKKKPGRKDFQRGIYTLDDSGQLFVKNAGGQGSHLLKSMSQANCLIELEKDRGNVESGEKVNIQLLMDK